MYNLLSKKETLKSYETVIYVDSSVKFKSNKIQNLLDIGKEIGILTRYLPLKTNCFTDHRMFKWFNLTRSNFNGLMTLEASLMIFQKTFITSLIMKAWVSCALDESCISPPGSTPLCGRVLTFYMCGPEGFSCHRFDQSALTLITTFFFRYPPNFLIHPPFGITYWEYLFYNFYKLKRGGYEIDNYTDVSLNNKKNIFK